MRKTILAAALSLVVGAAFTPAFSAEPQQGTHTAEDIKKAKPSGTVEVQAEQLRLIIGGTRGKGTLTYQGKKYPFTMKGVSAGGVGVSKVNAAGNVYFLNNPEDFAGTFTAVTAGVTVGKGKGASQFENDKGVLVILRSKSEGVALTLGLAAVDVELAK
jgi:hypothetical protein